MRGSLVRPRLRGVRRISRASDSRETLVAATSSPEPGLDVERLARALFAVHPLMYPQSWPDDDPDDIGSDPTEDATAIAAEYARLASENRSA
jgi:hypothetical protein